jgi:hypothetical protein
MKNAASVTIAKYTTLRTTNAVKTPAEAISLSAMGAIIRGPAPNPATALPVIIPRRSGNQRSSVATGTIYASPKPAPQELRT